MTQGKHFEKVPDKGLTHGCKFHADDVFATALLKIINPDIEITRANEVPGDFEGIVYDIGRGDFDHHQKDKEIRENGCPYAAFGLVWREFAHFLVDEEEQKHFDETFIQPLDMSDNTGCKNTLADIIDEFNPAWDEQPEYDECFDKAEAFAETILKNHINSYKSLKRADGFVRDAIEKCDGEILVLEKYVPWKKMVQGTTYKVAVYPSNRGGYGIQGVPRDPGGTKTVCDMPEEWWGIDGETLAKISGINTLRFCHASGFMASADTLEDAMLAAKKAIGK